MSAQRRHSHARGGDPDAAAGEPKLRREDDAPGHLAGAAGRGRSCAGRPHVADRPAGVPNGNRTTPRPVPNLACPLAIVRDPAQQGSRVANSRTLYEPSFEHDACGFGFVCDIAGRPSHGIVRDALTVLVNLEHRGASGSEKNTGDGAGILIQVPLALPRRGRRRAGARPAGRGRLRRGHGLPARATTASRAGLRGVLAQVARGRGPRAARLARRPDRTRPASARPPGRASRSSARSSSAGRPGVADDLAFDRRLYVARRLVEKAVSRSALPGRGDFYVSSLSCRTIVYKGMLNASQLLTLLPRHRRPAPRERDRDGPLALLDEHVPVVGARPPVPLHLPQRRDQHAARQRQLDPRPPVDVPLVALRRRPPRRCCPVVDAEGSDSAILDNVLELLHLVRPLARPRA